MFEYIKSILTKTTIASKGSFHNWLSGLNKDLDRVTYVKDYSGLKDYKKSLFASAKAPVVLNSNFGNDISYHDEKYNLEFQKLKDAHYEFSTNMEKLPPQSSILNAFSVVKKTLSFQGFPYFSKLTEPYLTPFNFLQKNAQNKQFETQYHQFNSDYLNTKPFLLSSGFSKGLFDYKDIDSKKYTVGLIPQFESNLFYDSYSNKLDFRVSNPTRQGLRTDFTLNLRENSNLNFDVKMFSLPTITYDNKNFYRVRISECNDSCPLNIDQVNTIVASTLSKTLEKNFKPDHKILLCINTTPSPQMLNTFFTFQNYYNSHVVHTLSSNLKKDLDCKYDVSNVKVYFFFNPLLGSEDPYGITPDVVKSNLYPLVESGVYNSSEVEKIVVSLKK